MTAEAIVLDTKGNMVVTAEIASGGAPGSIRVRLMEGEYHCSSYCIPARSIYMGDAEARRLHAALSKWLDRLGR